MKRTSLSTISLILLGSSSLAFHTSIHHRFSGVMLSRSSTECRRMRRSRILAGKESSYEVDSDENAEQALVDSPLPQSSINGSSNQINGEEEATSGRVQDKFHLVLEESGLSGKLKQVKNLPNPRIISPNDVFCNRELALNGIDAVGFDMDYTLAEYKEPEFDKLAFDGAKEKLVNCLGYPQEVLDFEYDHEFWVRGLIIDTMRGNILKIDRHKYVRVAYHGLTPISSSNRKLLYSRTFNKATSFSEKYFVNVDTLFQIVDAHLFASLIELKDKGNNEFLDLKTYEEIYRQVRECVDLCHRDGVIKDEVARNPEKYIVHDHKIIQMLQRFRNAGVKVFLLTNSYWEYTSVVCNYLFHGKKVNDDLKNQNQWLDLFDLVVVGSCKPAYLVDPYLNLFRVNTIDGTLRNTDGLFEIEALGDNGAQKFLEMGKVFQGGNWLHLQAMLDIKIGEQILYVGDHLYSDVLRSKRTLGWRTALIVPELDIEMNAFSNNYAMLKHILDLRMLRDELSSFADTLRRQGECTPAITEQLSQIKEDDNLIKSKLKVMAEKYHASFHPIWGQMYLAGYQDSRFAFYVANYACIYTSKASNLALVSTDRCFRTCGELLPHAKLISDPSTSYIDEEIH